VLTAADRDQQQRVEANIRHVLRQVRALAPTAAQAVLHGVFCSEAVLLTQRSCCSSRRPCQQRCWTQERRLQPQQQQRARHSPRQSPSPAKGPGHPQLQVAPLPSCRRHDRLLENQMEVGVPVVAV
jgi:hypothetical protein